MTTSTHGGHRAHSSWATWRLFWPVALVIPLATTAVAVDLSKDKPAVYRAEARLAVGSGEMSALNIPGYPQAAEEMAADYARWVTQQGVEGQIHREGVGLAASPITDSHVIRIEAFSTDAEQARLAAQEASDHLMQAVNQVAEENDPDRLMAQIETLLPEVTEARSAAEEARQAYLRAIETDASQGTIDQRLEEYVADQTTYETLELQVNGLRDRYRGLVSSRSTEADLRQIKSAEVVGSNAESVLQRDAMLGLVLGVVLAAIVMALLDRWRRARASRRERRAAGRPAVSDAGGPSAGDPEGASVTASQAGSGTPERTSLQDPASRPDRKDAYVDVAASTRD